MQRGIWIGGFAIGAILGAIILEVSLPAPATWAPFSVPSSNPNQSKTSAAAAETDQVSWQQQVSQQPTAYEQLVERTAASQGGRISVGQIAAIARITRSQPGAPTFEQLVAQVSAIQGGRISIAQMLALRGVIPQINAVSVGMPNYNPTITSGVSGGVYRPGAGYVTPYQGSAQYQDTRGPATRGADESIARQEFITRQTSGTTYEPSYPSASSSTFQSPSSQGLVDTESGQFMAPAAGGYTDPRNGTFYAQSGPNGLVDTSTGEFIPTH